MSADALERVLRRSRTQRAEAADRCGLCDAALPDRHRHLVDTEKRGVMCSCQACSLLFVQDAASQGHYRLVPERRIRLEAVSTKGLGVPVGLAFFVIGDEGATTAHYPSPMGSTQWEVDPEAWAQVVAECPRLGELAPEVEALLVNTARGRAHHWIVPIDDCYRLVAIVRREWQGLSGGSRVWPAIDAFFDELKER